MPQVHSSISSFYFIVFNLLLLVGDISLPVLKRYIAFCRARCSPRLSSDAATVLQNYYVNIRANVRQREIDGAPAAVPITVRQLEGTPSLSISLIPLPSLLSGMMSVSVLVTSSVSFTNVCHLEFSFAPPSLSHLH